MAVVRVNWFGKQVKLKLDKGIEQRLDVAAEYLKTSIINSLKTGYPPASSAGEAPHTRLGGLRRSINWQKNKPGVRRIGSGIGNASSVGYAAWLEFGTRRMAARPFLRPSLRNEKNRNTITKILGSKLI